MTLNLETQEYTTSLEYLRVADPIRIAIVLMYDYNNTRKDSVFIFLSSDTISRTVGMQMQYLSILASIVVIACLILLIFFLRRLHRRKQLLKRTLQIADGYNPLQKEGHTTVKQKVRRQVTFSGDLKAAYVNVGVSKDEEENNHNHYVNLNNKATEEDVEIMLNGLIYSPTANQLFNSVPKDCGKSTSFATDPKNKRKNRYKNNLPYDDTRVVLSTVNNDPYSDYINASLIKGKGGNRWYIATQGPKLSNESTIKDFWRMVVEMDVTCIAMLANFVENGKSKVGEYFNPDHELEIDEFAIKVTQRVQEPHFIRSIIQVTSHLENRLKQVFHYQFTKWPDHGIPTQILPLATMMQNLTNDFNEGGIVLHCSAGLGRTGTILMVLLLKEMYESESWIDPHSILVNMRETRAGLIENTNQFNLALSIFYEYLFGHIGNMSIKDFEVNLEDYREEGKNLYNRLGQQFIDHSYTFGRNHIKFNRSHNILPSDNSVVYFGHRRLENNDEYLNAISVDFEDIYNSVIVTEHPLQSVFYSFWKMVFLKQCSTIFLLNTIDESEEFPEILPLTKQFMDYGPFKLEVTESQMPYSDLGRKYTVKIDADKSSDAVDVFQVTDWPVSQEYPTDISRLQAIASYILQNASSSTPIVLCCSDGVTACGLVSASVAAISRLQVYQEINIYNSVLRVRRHRPQFIVSQTQFQILYDVIKEFLDVNLTYQNFK